MITIIGLGAGDITQISSGALQEIESGKKIFLRTTKHPIIDRLKIKGESFDSYYDSGDDFESVYESIAKKIVREGAESDIVYAVPGHPRVAEKSVALVEQYAKEKGINVKVIASMSFIDAMYTYLGFDPSEGFILIDAFSVKKKDLDADRNIIITQVYDRYIASDVKIRLMEYFEDDIDVVIVKAAGIENLEEKKTVKLYDLDHHDNDFDHLTSLYIEKNQKPRYKNISDLLDITARLRGEDGCPWDRRQNHKSLKRYVIEEAYEVADAIEKDDIDLLVEELGDLLYQITLHSQIGQEEGYFDFDEVCDGISRKMIYRHPNVFAEQTDTPANDLSWEQRKKIEKNEKTLEEGLKSIPESLPALIRAQKIQKKASAVGFDWDDVSKAIDKVDEEYREFLEEYYSGDIEKCEKEMGDLLFAIAKVAKFLDIDAENALNITNTKFINRLSLVEKEISADGKSFESLDITELESLWNMTKNKYS